MIIGVCGLIGSGKDTIAQYLVDSRGYDRISFATPLKNAAAELFGWDRTMLEGATPEARKQREVRDQFWSEKLGREWSPRVALQYVGTDLFRNHLHDDVWVIATEKRIRDAYLRRLGEYQSRGQTQPDVVISDVRFPNEIDMIRSLGGQIWRVKRGPEPEWYDRASAFNKITNFKPKAIPAAGQDLPHYSEWAWAGAEFDIVLENDGTLADLYTKVEEKMNG